MSKIPNAKMKSTLGNPKPISSQSEPDWGDMFSEILIRRKEKDLEAQSENLQQRLEALRERENELIHEINDVEDLFLSRDPYLADEVVGQATAKVEKEVKELQDKDEEIKNLARRCSELRQQKQERLDVVHSLTIYQQFMKKLVSMTSFEDEEALTNHIESLHSVEDQLSQREGEAYEQTNQQRKTQVALQKQYEMERQELDMELTHLMPELFESKIKVEYWFKEWKRIEETASRKLNLLAQIKMSILSLYEMIGGKVCDKLGVALNETEKQLEKIHAFMLDHFEIVKEYEAQLNAEN
ncbi:centrosomal protein of 290 kDa-like [Dunckerocampus dactyliophorus]|uniref:centrosomal protein of 290 kDa-like n=1 Tax=Dunckerocampus dactyliophorus TaxID=161453 RepID=UPI002406CA26|nr:centrosomal protein of 290 kDa-like [Dunckerocampus dactyliophorus]